MQQGRNHNIPWIVLGSASFMSFAMWAPLACVPPMEHVLKEELSLTHAQTSLLFTTPLIMMAALSIPAGIIADRIGIRRAAGIAAIIIAGGSILRGTATDFATLLAFTFIYGAGLALAWPNLVKLVSVPKSLLSLYIPPVPQKYKLPSESKHQLVAPCTPTV